MIAQIAILILSAAAIFLVGSPETILLGMGIGLAAQPFWFWETLRNRQWGMFLLSVFYTAAYARGIFNYWPA